MKERKYCRRCGLKLVLRRKDTGFNEETGKKKYFEEMVCPESDTNLGFIKALLRFDIFSFFSNPHNGDEQPYY